MPTPTVPLPADLLTTEGLLRPQTELTFSHAAQICGCTVDTVRRRRKEGRLPNARQDQSPYARWWVPVADLVNAGLLESHRVQPTQAPPQGRGDEPAGTRAEVSGLHEQVEALRRALAASQEQVAGLIRVLERTTAAVGA
jgi:hypothetical protein